MKVTKKKLKRIAKLAKVASQLEKLVIKGLLKNGIPVRKQDKLERFGTTTYFCMCTGQRVDQQSLDKKLAAIEGRVTTEKYVELEFESMYPVYTAIKIG